MQLVIKYSIIITLFLCSVVGFTQVTNARDSENAVTTNTAYGIVTSSSTQFPMENVHVVNLNQVIGTITNKKGEFSIKAEANDTLHFSFLGYKSFKVKVTSDWLKYQNTAIELTEAAYALEEVVIKSHNLTGYLEIDAKYVPSNSDPGRYSISGLTKSYEAGKKGPNTIGQILGAVFNPADLLYKVFGKKPKQMRKLKQMKKDNEIRDLLAAKFDRELLVTLLEVDVAELEEILIHCNYSKSFIKTANDLQILDAINSCYEEYKVLKRKKV
jgi:hypothetical protein